MINNNPYNTPDLRSHKINRIYTETTATNYRNDSVQNIPVYTHHHNVPNNVYQNRPQFNANLVMKKSTTFNAQDNQNGNRINNIPQIRNQIQHYLPSPKNNSPNLNKFANLQNFANSSQPTNGHLTETTQKNETDRNNSQMAILLDSRQITEKLEKLSKAMKVNQKRIADLQRNHIGSSISNISKLSEADQIHQYKFDLYSSNKDRQRNQKQENMRKLRDQIIQAREQIKNYLQSNDANKIINQKVQEITHMSINQSHNHNNQQYEHLRRQVQQMRRQLQQKIYKNYDTVSTAMARVQRQIHNNNHNLIGQYKSSGIKCTGTAILLRFVQCFKVRKNSSHHHSSNKGQMKITLMDNTYYIDNQGYLLDKQQCYLIDGRGMQIKLQQQHIKILKQQNVLI